MVQLTGNGLMYLGRAWGRYSTVVYAYTYMADIIIPEGWYNWNDPAREKTVHYGQYQSYKPGARENKRVPWSHDMSSTEVASFFSISYIDGESWIK